MLTMGMSLPNSCRERVRERESNCVIISYLLFHIAYQLLISNATYYIVANIIQIFSLRRDI